MRAAFLTVFLACQMATAQATRESAAPVTFVVGISPYLDDNLKDEIYRNIVRLVVQDLPLNSSLVVYDAFELKTITRVTLPNVRAFESAKTRANQFATAIHDIKQFLAQPHAKPKVEHLNFDGAIRLPQFCDFLSENLPTMKEPVVLLLIGSPLYQDQKEPGFSMVDGYFPSDGHLQASRDKSIFGVSDTGAAHRSWVVHWVYFGDPWVSDLHKEKITRFWTLYLQRRGANLASFCGDLPTAMQGFVQGPSLARTAPHWSVNPQETKIEMLRIGREVELADWIERDSIRQNPASAPSVMFGPMKIGIRWKDNIDLDLYATPRAGAETLFFQHPRTLDGYYYKDHRSSPGREYEFIEFEKSIDAREVEAFVNFYKGSCPAGPTGEVRIEFDGRIYSGPFSISAAHGNRGRSGVTQEEFWARIPVQEILKLSHAPVTE